MDQPGVARSDKEMVTRKSTESKLREIFGIAVINIPKNKYGAKGIDGECLYSRECKYQYVLE